MSKRIVALLLTVIMLLPCLAGCGKNDDDPGAYITMYLTDDLYDFDPINAFYNADARNVVSLLFDTLFTLNSSGKVEKSLAKSYKIVEDTKNNEYSMEIKLKDSKWSNKSDISAEDVVYAWKRLLRSNDSYEAASLLFDIKNARAVKDGEVSIDDVGIEAIEAKTVKVTFEGKTDYDQFLLNLTSIATAPLYENYVSKNPDWAKKPSTMATSGAYKLGKIKYATVEKNGKAVTTSDDHRVKGSGEANTNSPKVQTISYFYLERNIYYRRNVDRDKIDKSVKNYRILVDCTKTDEEILQEYNDGKLFYFGSIPLSLRNNEEIKKNVKISDALSTFVLSLNEKAEIGGIKLFSDAKVRKALSLAIDRQAIADEVVYAKAATAIVPNGVLEGNSGKKTFRSVGGDLISATADIDAAKTLLAEANITASKYSFSIKVASYDEVHLLIAKKVAEAWKALGFQVTVQEVFAIQNNDYFKEVDDTPKDVCDDQLIEALQYKDFEVIAYDSVAYSASAYSVLANFAVDFAGQAYDPESEKEGSANSGATGYNSEQYNLLIEAIYYLPYFATLNRDSSSFLGLYETTEEFQKLYDAIKAIYDENGITPSTKAKDWEKQRAMLLHKAESILAEDLPVIPVVFNQNATLCSKKLTDVKSDYYVPSLFKTAKLKNYEKYSFKQTTYDAEGYFVSEENVSIFAEFPIVPDDEGKTAWDYYEIGEKIIYKKS